jgi:hypothetical protein
MKGVVASVVFACCHSVLAQGTFENLNFEEANTTTFTPPSIIPAADAFPAWEASVGGVQVSLVGYEDPNLYAAGLDLVGSQLAIQGDYSALLESSPAGGTASLTQTAVIPAGTESIQLDAGEENAGNFWVEINGNRVNMFPLQPNAGSTPYGVYTLYDGNVSAWAGQSATLSIIQLTPNNSGPLYVPSFLELDNISFSPTAAVPEPSPVALSGVGSVFFAVYRRCVKKR